jgi:hypothetical protein
MGMQFRAVKQADDRRCVSPYDPRAHGFSRSDVRQMLAG